MDFIQPPSNPTISPLSCLHWQLHWQSKSCKVVHLVCIDSHSFWTMCWCQLDSVAGIFLHQLHGDALLPLASTSRSYWFYFWPRLTSYWCVWCLPPSTLSRAFSWGLCLPACNLTSFHPVQHCTSLLSQLDVFLPKSGHSFPVISSINDVIQCGICNLSSTDPMYFTNLTYLTSPLKKKKVNQYTQLLRVPSM